jgi:hypothetical protein
MALAPTLLTFLTIAPSAAAAAIGGQVPTYDIAYPQPARASLSISGLIPTVLQQAGPYAGPEIGEVTLNPLGPTLLTTLIVYPTLPDAAGESNDLSVTVLWEANPAPLSGLITVGGLSPSLIINDGQIVTPAYLSAPATMAGLVPDLVISLQEQPLKTPREAQLGMILLEPTMVTTVTLENGVDSPITMVGLAPSFSFRYGWTTVEAATTPVWTDVGSP